MVINNEGKEPTTEGFAVVIKKERVERKEPREKKEKVEERAVINKAIFPLHTSMLQSKSLPFSRTVPRYSDSNCNHTNTQKYDT